MNQVLWIGGREEDEWKLRVRRGNQYRTGLENNVHIISYTSFCRLDRRRDHRIKGVNRIVNYFTPFFLQTVAKLSVVFRGNVYLRRLMFHLSKSEVCCETCAFPVDWRCGSSRGLAMERDVIF